MPPPLPTPPISGHNPKIVLVFSEGTIIEQIDTITSFFFEVNRNSYRREEAKNKACL